MNEFERQASTPPPPSPFSVLNRYGKAGKLKVFAFGQVRIMTREQVIKFAKGARKIGAAVSLNGLITEAEMQEKTCPDCDPIQGCKTPGNPAGWCVTR